ncbi:MAG TPA: hypothetical protein VE861_09075, partial [Gemmatimonadaceae bacterium]|nr:hypothetical protein [Gemmatimonadaceae bacterium]
MTAGDDANDRGSDTTRRTGVGRREMLAWVLAGALALTLVGRFAFDRTTQAARADDLDVGQARTAVTDL